MTLYVNSAGDLLTDSAGNLCEECCPEEDCNCCTGAQYPNELYVRLTNLNLGGCDALEEQCYKLTRTTSCTWIGANALGALLLKISCVGGVTTLNLSWNYQAGGSATFIQTISQSTIDCTDCSTYSSLVATNSSVCTTAGISGAVVSFARSQYCCNTCGEPYQVSILTAGDASLTSPCQDGDCQQLIGVYPMEFVGNKKSPHEGACLSNAGEWCEYLAFIDQQCQLAPQYGFCTLHLFLRTTPACGTDIVIELKYDLHATLDCDNGPDTRQGWRKLGVTSDCKSLDETFTNVCIDTDWICKTSNNDFTFRVQAV